METLSRPVFPLDNPNICPYHRHRTNNPIKPIPSILYILLVPMCIQDALQSKIAELTNNGDDIAMFLADILHGADPTVKASHRLEAARLLSRYGSQVDVAGKLVVLNADSKEDNGQHKPAPTLRDVVGYPAARYIRARTNDGETLISSLRDIMDGGEYNLDPFTGEIKPTVKRHERIAAAKELMRRAFGESSPPRRASVPFDRDEELDPADPANADIARLIRDRTNNGIDAAELLIRVVENDDGEWLSGHRLAADRELLHRAYDLNFDAVTWQDIEAFLRASEEYNEPSNIERTRRQTDLAAIIEEYEQAEQSGDEDAMRAAEEKFEAYCRAAGDPDDEPEEYAEYGPSDPDPTPDSPRPRREPRRNPKNRRRPAAASIHPPKLTIPLHNRSP